MKEINAIAAFSFTSPRVRGEVGIERSEMPGEGGAPRVRLCGDSPSPIADASHRRSSKKGGRRPQAAYATPRKNGERGRTSAASGWRH